MKLTKPQEALLREIGEKPRRLYGRYRPLVTLLDAGLVRISSYYGQHGQHSHAEYESTEAGCEWLAAHPGKEAMRHKTQPKETT